MKILNLSNHNLTDLQIKELKEKLEFTEIVELDVEDKKIWGQLNPGNYHEETTRIMDKYDVVAYHVAGFAPAVVYAVEIAENNMKPCYYAYSERKVIEKENEDGTVVKTAVFEHKGFYLY